MIARAGLRFLLPAATLLFALVPLFAAAAEQRVRSTTPSADAGAAVQVGAVETDAAQAARIDDLLEATALPALYDRLLRSLKNEPPGSDKAVVAVWRDLIDRVSWRRIETRWRTSFAERLDPQQIAEIVAYYRSPSGWAMIDCLSRINGRVVESECLDDVSNADSDAYRTFIASPTGRIWAEAGAGAAGSLVIETLCADLDRDLSLRRRLLAVCANGAPLGFCRMLASAEPGVEPSLDPAVCPGTAGSDSQE